MGGLRLLSLTGVIAGFVLGVGALGLGGSQAEADNVVEATVEAAIAAWNDGDSALLASYFTDEGLMAQFDVTREDAIAGIDAIIEETGPIASAEVSNVQLAGGKFTAYVDIQFASGGGFFEEWEFIQTADGWLIGAYTEVSRPIPPGVPAVDLELKEYAFVYNEAAMQAADGNFAFSVSNTGEEVHEVVILGIDSDKSLLELLQSSDPESEDMPEGVSFVSFGGVFEPGAEGTVVLEQPLAAGKYGLICFIPTPAGVPHAFVGMISEFSIGSMGPVDQTPGGGGTSGGGIIPPNTGDAGLFDAGSSTAGIAVLGLALTLITGAALRMSRSRASAGA